MLLQSDYKGHCHEPCCSAAAKRQRTVLMIALLLFATMMSAVLTLLLQSHFGVHLCASEIVAALDSVKQLPMSHLRRLS